MTTITYRGGTMACDSCWAHDGVVDTLSTKIRRLKSGALLGEAGDFDTRDIVKLLENVKTYEELPNLKKLQDINLSYTGLLIFPDRRIVKIETIEKDEEDSSAGLWPIAAPFTAIGSGRSIALGAMAQGATAKQAVTIACQYDINSKLPVHSLRLSKTK